MPRYSRVVNGKLNQMPIPVSRNPTASSIVLSAVKSRSGEIIVQQSKATDLPSHDEIETLTNPSHVSTELSITKNMDNFESLKVGVSITSPCRNEDGAKMATHQHNLDLAMKLLAKEAEIVSKEWF